MYTQLSQWDRKFLNQCRLLRNTFFFLHAEMYDDEITYIIHTYLLKGGKTMQSWTLWDNQ